MFANLPPDLIEFLKAGRQLDYVADGSIIGRISFKRHDEVLPSTITISPGCDAIIDDPYEDLPGVYPIEIYDLVAESERYRPKGLFCWIVALQQFGCVDDEHGSVIAFPGVPWSTIVKRPLDFLEAQWIEQRDLTRILPWLHFPFVISELDVVLPPYPSTCPVHNTAVTVHRAQKQPLFELWRRRELGDWLLNYQAKFPCSGVPVANNKLLCCSACRAAEDAWTKQIAEEIAPIDARPNAHGWVQCPGCGSRFMATDGTTFRDGIHLRCGQRINVIAR